MSYKPVVKDSHLTSGEDDGCVYVDMSCDDSGTTEFAPNFTDTMLDGSTYGIEAYVDGPGNTDSPVKANGTFTDCYIRGIDDYGFYIDAGNDGGSCEAKPVLTRCTIDAPDDYGVYVDVNGYGPAGTMVIARRSSTSAPPTGPPTASTSHADGNGRLRRPRRFCVRPDISVHTGVFDVGLPGRGRSRHRRATAP